MTRSLALLLITLTASPLLAADRLTDKDVKALAERIDDGRDKFEDSLDGKLKNSIVRGPNGEAIVGKYLDDFKQNVDKLKDRLNSNYAASAEAAAVLRQASTIDVYMQQQPSDTKGKSEWNRLATDLKTLARAYGADFPLAPNAPVRRMGDGEVAAAADQIAKGADQLKKTLNNDLKKDKTIDKPTREQIVGDADQLSKDAKTLRDRVKGGDPSSAEAASVLEGASRIRTFMEGHNGLPTASGAWSDLASKLTMIATAFNVAPPASR
jgi:hypothetical protein